MFKRIYLDLSIFHQALILRVPL